MTKKRPIGIDLFAGAGGLSLAFEQAGFDVVAAVEIDPVHAATHHFNFPSSAIIPRSVIGLTGSDVRSIANLGDAHVDVVFGGAPCQGFSLIGQRLLDDPRNRLVREFVRLVSELKADYFVFENVKGLTVGKHRRFLGELISAFEKKGYAVRQPWRVLNACNFGVPQNRERLFLLGARTGLPLPDYPLPTTMNGNKSSRDGSLPPTPTCLDALGDLPNAEDFDDLNGSDVVEVASRGRPSKYASELRCASPGCWHHGYERAWNPNELTASMRTEHTAISRRRFAETSEGDVEPISRFFKLPSKGICNTLRAGTDSARGAFTSPRPIHYAFPRCITVREMARLHGYPDWFRFHVTKWHGARQVGNSVPPPLGRAVASSVMVAMGGKPRRPRRTVRLVSPELLSLDMGQAAEFFGIPVPINGRDRKNGSRKRKQEEIESARRAAAKEQ